MHGHEAPRSPPFPPPRAWPPGGPGTPPLRRGRHRREPGLRPRRRPPDPGPRPPPRGIRPGRVFLDHRRGGPPSASSPDRCGRRGSWRPWRSMAADLSPATGLHWSGFGRPPPSLRYLGEAEGPGLAGIRAGSPHGARRCFAAASSERCPRPLAWAWAPDGLPPRGRGWSLGHLAAIQPSGWPTPPRRPGCLADPGRVVLSPTFPSPLQALARPQTGGWDWRRPPRLGPSSGPPPGPGGRRILEGKSPGGERALRILDPSAALRLPGGEASGSGPPVSRRDGLPHLSAPLAALGSSYSVKRLLERRKPGPCRLRGPLPLDEGLALHLGPESIAAGLDLWIRPAWAGRPNTMAGAAGKSGSPHLDAGAGKGMAAGWTSPWTGRKPGYPPRASPFGAKRGHGAPRRPSGTRLGDPAGAGSIGPRRQGLALPGSPRRCSQPPPSPAGRLRISWIGPSSPSSRAGGEGDRLSMASRRRPRRRIEGVARRPRLDILPLPAAPTLNDIEPSLRRRPEVHPRGDISVFIQTESYRDGGGDPPSSGNPPGGRRGVLKVMAPNSITAGRAVPHRRSSSKPS
jgi:hypothetical protein